MITFLEDLRLWLLLRATVYLLRRAQKRSPRMRRHMAADNFVLQVQTPRGTGCYFELRDGTIRLVRGIHPRPDFTQTWRDPGDAFRVLTSREESEMLRAVEGGLCRLRGRFLVALWFNEAVRIARSGDLEGGS